MRLVGAAGSTPTPSLSPSVDSPAAVSRSPLTYIDEMTFKYERIDKDNVALLIVDHQEGLFQLARDKTPQEFKSSILAHAELAKVFNLPTVLTSSAETGTQLVTMYCVSTGK